MCPDCRAQQERHDPSASRRIAIVRRPDTATFEALRERLQELNLAEVIWDRRVRERRAAKDLARPSDRRRSRRRAPPPSSWSVGFLIARLGGEPPEGVPLGHMLSEERNTVQETRSVEMQEPVDVRHRLTRWAEDSQQMLREIPGVLAEHDQWKSRAEAAEQECERLRQEVSQIGETLQRVLSDLQLLNESLQRFRELPRRTANP